MRKALATLALMAGLTSAAYALPHAQTFVNMSMSYELYSAVKTCVTSSDLRQKQDACFKAAEELRSSDPLRALLYATEGAKAGSAPCMEIAGHAYLIAYARLGMTENEGARRAFPWYEHGCYAGNADACIMYAEFFSNVPLARKAGTKISERGLNILKETCEKRNPEACSLLGNKLIDQYKRPSEGKEYLHKACKYSGDDARNMNFYCSQWFKVKGDSKK